MNQITQLKPALQTLAILTVAIAAAKALGVSIPFVKTGVQNTCLLAATLAWVGK